MVITEHGVTIKRTLHLFHSAQSIITWARPIRQLNQRYLPPITILNIRLYVH